MIELALENDSRQERKGKEKTTKKKTTFWFFFDLNEVSKSSSELAIKINHL